MVVKKTALILVLSLFTLARLGGAVFAAYVRRGCKLNARFDKTGSAEKGKRFLECNRFSTVVHCHAYRS